MPSDSQQPQICPQCNIRNPVGVKVCVNCGYNFSSGKAPPAPKTVQKSAPAKALTSPSPERSERQTYRAPLNQDSGIIPGRPGWLSAYAVLLSIMGAGVILGMGIRFVTGSILTTYNDFAPAVLIVAACIIGIVAGVDLWGLRERGRILAMGLAIIWTVSAAVGVIWTLQVVPRNPRSSDVHSGMAFVGFMTFFMLILFIRPLLSTPMTQLTDPDRNSAFRWFLFIIGALLVGIFAAGAILLLDPKLIINGRLDEMVAGALLDGVILSILLNGIVLIGLHIERQRFT